MDVQPRLEKAIPLSDILETGLVDERYFLRYEDMPRWIYTKGAKNEPRKRRDGSSYYFTEGAVPFPDPLDRPSRTMLTSESQVGRASHVVKDPLTGRLRTLTPVESERLNGFPDGWTALPGASDAARYKALGNSVAIPCVEYVMQGIAWAMADR